MNHTTSVKPRGRGLTARLTDQGVHPHAANAIVLAVDYLGADPENAADRLAAHAAGDDPYAERAQKVAAFLTAEAAGLIPLQVWPDGPTPEWRAWQQDRDITRSLDRQDRLYAEEYFGGRVA